MSKYFQTSDGEEFYTENHAQSHARSLTDKTVTPPTIEVEEEESVPTPVLKLSDMTRKELIALADTAEIKVNPKDTNAAIIAVIEEAQAVIVANDLEVVEDETLNTQE